MLEGPLPRSGDCAAEIDRVTGRSEVIEVLLWVMKDDGGGMSDGPDCVPSGTIVLTGSEDGVGALLAPRTDVGRPTTEAGRRSGVGADRSTTDGGLLNKPEVRLVVMPVGLGAEDGVCPR